MAEEYKGVRFLVPSSALERKPVKTSGKIDDMVRWGSALSAKGLAQNRAGNLSIREDDGFIITASGARLSSLGKDDFVLVEEFDVVNFSLRKAQGMSNPSSETPLHFLIYRLRDDVGAVVHVHSLSARADTEVDGFPYGSKPLALVTANALIRNDLVMIKGHGLVSVGKTIEEAANRILQSL